MAKQTSNETSVEPAGNGLFVLRNFVDSKTGATHEKGSPCPDAEPAILAKWKRLGYVGQKPPEPKQD